MLFLLSIFFILNRPAYNNLMAWSANWTGRTLPPDTCAAVVARTSDLQNYVFCRNRLTSSSPLLSNSGYAAPATR
jgi:hypothetical protein